jgi:hypothetical protein
MATFTKVVLSGSTNGMPVKVAATSTPGTTIHTTGSGTSTLDEVWLWATNTDSSARTITIEYGGTTDPDNLVTKAYSIAANSAPTLLIPGLLLCNSLVIKAFASTANVVLCEGFVNRISPS